MGSLIEDVRAFQEKFGVPMADTPTMLTQDQWEFRKKFLEEELRETLVAYEVGDGAGVADGLVDLIYVAIGTGLLMGLPMQELWDEVQAANMRKVRVESADKSKRGHAWDVVKPQGWQPPDFTGLLPDDWFVL